MLLNRKHTWVKCFTSRRFTAGTQSTQRVKSENALIKKAVQSSFSLLQVQESLENQLEFESINNRYSIWKASTLQYTQPFVIQTFFSSIDSIINKYLTQPIHDAYYKQMCQSVCYRAHQVQFSEIPVSDDGSFEPFFDKVEDSAESLIEADEDRELDLKSLISMVSFNDILEVWKISRYNYPKCYQHVILLNTREYLCTCFMLVTHGIICRHFFKVFVESSNACFHLTLIPKHWYKDEYINSSDTYSSETITSNGQNDQNSAQITLEFARKYTINDLSERYSKQISRNQLKFGTLMGEAKKAIQFAIQDNDEELIQFIKNFNKRKEAQLIQAESIKQQKALADRKMNDNRVLCNTKGVLIDSNQILDPLKRQPKGRPPTKRLKPSVEKSDSKGKGGGEQAISDRCRKCSSCGEYGHYRSTCSKG